MAVFEYDVFYDGSRESPDLVSYVRRELERVHSALSRDGFRFEQTFSPEYDLSYLVKKQNGSDSLSVLMAVRQKDSPNVSKQSSQRVTLTFFGVEKEILPFKIEMLKRTKRLRLE